ncbi:hypothetical protein MAP00_003918 [Monascus purpureus]|nr:hypothetical protein MAP00_003918 [Monascus purpureus]
MAPVDKSKYFSLAREGQGMLPVLDHGGVTQLHSRNGGTVMTYVMFSILVLEEELIGRVAELGSLAWEAMYTNWIPVHTAIWAGITHLTKNRMPRVIIVNSL